MRWKDVQAHYRKLFYQGKRERQLTQTAIATAAGLTQPDVSRLMGMEGNDGPQVDTLLRAIDGLGVSVSDFFLQIERQTNGDLSSDAIADRTATPLDGVAPHGRRQDRPVSVDATSLLKAGDALVEAGGRLIAAASGIEVGKNAGSADRVRRAKPAKGASRATHR